jgi:hypothetical protein
MPSAPPQPRAAGVILAAAILIGAVVGVAQGQPSAGVIIGVGLGALIALLLWLWDRARG